MKTCAISLALLQIFICSTLSLTIPSFVHLCARNDPQLSQCFINTVEEIRPYLRKGIPEMNLPPGDLLYFPNITAVIGRGARTVVVDIHSWNQVATGLMDVKIKEIKINLATAKCTATLMFPYVRLQGQYRLKGKILLFEIDSVGHYDLNTTDVLAEVEWNGKFYNRNNMQHIKFEKVKLEFKQLTPTVHFSNLINGNELLTENINQAINTNFDFIKEEVVPVAEEVLADISLDYFNRVFRLFPVDQLFPKNNHI